MLDIHRFQIIFFSRSKNTKQQKKNKFPEETEKAEEESASRNKPSEESASRKKFPKGASFNGFGAVVRVTPSRQRLKCALVNKPPW